MDINTKKLVELAAIKLVYKKKEIRRLLGEYHELSVSHLEAIDQKLPNDSLDAFKKMGEFRNEHPLIVKLHKIVYSEE